MERHPLLKELLRLCSEHDIRVTKAYITFDVYQELLNDSEVLSIEHSVNENLKLFYLRVQKAKSEYADIYVPVSLYDEMTFGELSCLQKMLSCKDSSFHLVIRDKDSSSACYTVTKGLVKPSSPEECKMKRELERKKYDLAKDIKNKRKMLYSKALISTKFIKETL